MNQSFLISSYVLHNKCNKIISEPPKKSLSRAAAMQAYNHDYIGYTGMYKGFLVRLESCSHLEITGQCPGEAEYKLSLLCATYGTINYFYH